MKQITEDSNGTEVDLAVGETLEVLLHENRTTGFKWVLESGGEGVCVPVGDAFERGSAIGQPGTRRWEFRAERTGSAVIKLSYQRPWEQQHGEQKKGEEKQTPARKFTLKVRVRD